MGKVAPGFVSLWRALDARKHRTLVAARTSALLTALFLYVLDTYAAIICIAGSMLSTIIITYRSQVHQYGGTRGVWKRIGAELQRTAVRIVLEDRYFVSRYCATRGMQVCFTLPNIHFFLAILSRSVA